MKNNTTSKEAILSRLRKHQPAFVKLPDIGIGSTGEEKLLDSFTRRLKAVGSTCLKLEKGQKLTNLISSHFPKEQAIVSTVPGFQGTISLDTIYKPAELANTGLAILPARLGVAENGAVWLTEEDCGFRVLPFITQHLAVVLSSEKLVPNMHHAYHEIRIDETGFGVFIAGPSKTADIEQSLVIGAQGPRSFTVILQ